MMTEQEKVPAIRFAGFTDPWEQRKLGDVTDSFSGGTPDVSHTSYYGGSIPFIRSAEINSDKTELFLTEKGLDNSSAKIVERGTVLYALYGATSGEVGIAAIKGAINQAILALSPHTGNDPLFLASWLRREKARIVDTYLQGGQGNLSGSIVKELSFALPQQKEQQVIGSFFSRLDNLITLHQRKYDKLVIFKKSMLEKMFPKDGESVPEIRFAGFTDPWEQRKLGEIVSIGAGAPPSAFSAGNFLYVKVDDLNESSHFQFDSAQRVDANTAVKPIRKGSIIFAKRGAAILGNKVRVLGKTAYIDTNMMALEPRGVDADFLWLFINQTGLYRIADTSTIPQINNKHIEPYPVDIPNMAEQQAIGTFFSRLDDLITLHQRKLELLQDIKKSLLDKMFV
ncbi:restriction endonuclease subunit S [Bifidobacterium longum]|nr:restriction endonuclease subunit S [Bifidobacterium longum]MCG4649146.1 restriction endonuclease subunit S [Bifidobacterium longum]